jgi:hypothetical protein
MDKVISLYNFLKSDKKKERFDIILEPLQALTQLSALAFCPIGSKLTISNNLLYIQIPGWGQGLLRSFNNDKHDDLFFLFNVIVRFNDFYGYLKNTSGSSGSGSSGGGGGEEDTKLFKLLIKLAKQGIDNLLLTYSTIDQPSLLHTLQMYQTLLDNPELIIRNNTGTSGAGTSGAGTASTNNTKSSNNGSKKNNNDIQQTENIGESQNQIGKEDINIITNNSKKGINDVFINIRKLYSAHERSILFHLLTLMEKHPDQHQTYLEAINAALNPINNQIKKWINDNIVY